MPRLRNPMFNPYDYNWPNQGLILDELKSECIYHARKVSNNWLYNIGNEQVFNVSLSSIRRSVRVVLRANPVDSIVGIFCPDLYITSSFSFEELLERGGPWGSPVKLLVSAGTTDRPRWEEIEVVKEKLGKTEKKVPGSRMKIVAMHRYNKTGKPNGMVKKAN